jgi:predicted nucleotidyltransferase
MFGSMARSEAKDGSDVDQFFEGALTSISLQNWR